MKFFTTDLCDKYNNKTQVLNAGFNSYGGVSKLNGQIATCKLINNNTELIKLLKSKGKEKVCVVDVDAKYVAVAGDKLMAFAKENDWAGIIVNSYIGDTQTTKNIEVGLSDLGTCPKKATIQNSGECGLYLDFTNVTFVENNYLYANMNGVIVSK